MTNSIVVLDGERVTITGGSVLTDAADQPRWEWLASQWHYGANIPESLTPAASFALWLKREHGAKIEQLAEGEHQPEPGLVY